MRNESLQHYALRLAELIDEPSPTIIGVSLGGMMATEIAKANPLAKAIIISSNKTYKEFPGYLRNVIRYMPLYKFTTRFTLCLLLKPIFWILGAKGKQQRQLLKRIVLESNQPFNRWAIEAIGKWRNVIVPANVIHIHGRADKLLPYKKVKADFTIEGGAHVMVMDKWQEISNLLKKLITAVAD